MVKVENYIAMIYSHLFEYSGQTRKNMLFSLFNASKKVCMSSGRLTVLIKSEIPVMTVTIINSIHFLIRPDILYVEQYPGRSTLNVK